MTDDEIRRLRALCEAATPGPWETSETRHCVFAGYFPLATTSSTSKDGDAAFIAAARTALPELLDEVERLRAELSRVMLQLDVTKDHLTVLARRDS